MFVPLFLTPNYDLPQTLNNSADFAGDFDATSEIRRLRRAIRATGAPLFTASWNGVQSHRLDAVQSAPPVAPAVGPAVGPELRRPGVHRFAAVAPVGGPEPRPGVHPAGSEALAAAAQSIEGGSNGRWSGEDEPASASNGSPAGGNTDFRRMDRVLPTGPPFVCPILSRVDGTPCNRVRVRVRVRVRRSL